MKHILFRPRPIARAYAPVELKRTLGTVQLAALGIGAMIGAGIFVLTRTAAAGSAFAPGSGFGIWLAVGLAIYFVYSIRGTALQRRSEQPLAAPLSCAAASIPLRP